MRGNKKLFIGAIVMALASVLLIAGCASAPKAGGHESELVGTWSGPKGILTFHSDQTIDTGNNASLSGVMAKIVYEYSYDGTKLIIKQTTKSWMGAGASITYTGIAKISGKTLTLSSFHNALVEDGEYTKQ